MNEPRIHHPDPASEFDTEERCHILESWNDPMDTAVSVARARVEPGVRTQLHRLNGVTERYVILEGTGVMAVGELPPTPVGPGDVVFIPAGVSQRIENVGSVDLIFHCVCTPAFYQECYEALE